MDDSHSHTSGGSDLDNLLAIAGYNVRSSDLRHVAHRLETLDNVTSSSSASADVTSPDFPLFNPSDLSSLVGSLLPDTLLPPPLSPWTTTTTTTDPFPLTSVNADVEEDSGIRLVHLLMTSADSVQRGDLSLTASLLEEMKLLLKLVNTTRGMGKVAGYFIDALSRRLYSSPPPTGYGFEHEILYHHFYEACPYLKFAHFTANQAILEAFHGYGRVHVIDFSIMQGLQWPPLIQALALRPGGPPCLTVTGIGPRSLDGRDSLHEVELKLGQMARSVNVRFTFHGVPVSSLEDVEPWMLRHVRNDEAVAINSILQLHRIIGSGPGSGPIDSVLGWMKALSPKIVTVVEQETNHNRAGYLDRFTEALHYYSTMFDSLEACDAQPEKALAEMYIQREICNILCCEGPDRVERHEPLGMWRARLGRAGFKPLHLGSNAFKQASMLLNLFSAEGYCVEENDGCLTLGWHSRPLIAASAWQVGPSNGLVDGPN